MTTFTKEQMAALSVYEERLRTASRSQWCRAVTGAQFREVYGIWKEASGEILDNNANCGSCVLRLFARCGAAYYAQLEAEARVKTVKAKATTQRSVKVKTKKAK